MEFQTITITQYLTRKDIPFVERNGELITKCLFNDCDQDSRPDEAHLYFHAETGQYDCKKCGEIGNLVTLAKHLGDTIEDISLNLKKISSTKTVRNSKKFTPQIVEECHNALPDHIRQYLNTRGLTDTIIEDYKLGWGEFYGKWWITIPIKNTDGEYAFFKLRKDPTDSTDESKYKFYPAGSEATLYCSEMLKNNEDSIVICEGEFDCLILVANGIPAITSTAGAGTFKKEWVANLKNLKKVYLCFDKDDAGNKGSERLIPLMHELLPRTAIHQITFPERMIEGKDITDYFTKYKGNPDELIYQCSKQVAGRLPIDVSRFNPLSSQELIHTLGLTIKKDEENKLIAFLCALSAYTEQSQFNISFNAPSSTGKSFIPLEVSSFFPLDDLIKLGNCSPTAFFHEEGQYDKEKNTITVDLSRKILIFLDQPHTDLLERLRSLLSHDQKSMVSKITDKTGKGSNKTKTVIIKGYPAVIFCSAGLRIDEQESTRFILLSPETSQEKIRSAILEKIKKESDYPAYIESLNANPERQLLKERIEAIREEHIDEIKIANPEKIVENFLSNKNMLKPRHQRDVGRLMALTKIFALINVWFREREGSTIIATDQDIEEAMKLWDKMSESQEYNLPPYIYELYKAVIIPVYQEKNGFGFAETPLGVSRQEILKKHYQVYGRMVPDWQLRQQIIPMLETAGLITQEPDPDDKRKILISPTTDNNNSSKKDIVSESGV